MKKIIYGFMCSGLLWASAQAQADFAKPPKLERKIFIHCKAPAPYIGMFSAEMTIPMYGYVKTAATAASFWALAEMNCHNSVENSLTELSCRGQWENTDQEALVQTFFDKKRQKLMARLQGINEQEVLLPCSVDLPENHLDNALEEN